MSGFEKVEPYFCGQFHVKLQYSIEEYEKFLLPKILQWRDESDTILLGDSTICAYKFLHHIIPYLVEALVTDGIYFINDFPNHIITQFLIEKIPGYRQWAVVARRQAKE